MFVFEDGYSTVGWNMPNMLYNQTRYIYMGRIFLAFHYLGLWRIDIMKKRAHPELNQGPADLQSAALTTELYTHST